MLALLRVAGRFGAAEELANETVRRTRHAEREPLGSRELQVGHLARAGRDAADALQAQVRAVMGAHEVAPGREDPTTDRGVTEGGDHRTGGAREDRRRVRKLVDRPVPAPEDDAQTGARRAPGA